MLMRPILELYDILDSSFASGKAINTYFEQFDTSQVEIRTMSQQGHATDFVKIQAVQRPLLEYWGVWADLEPDRMPLVLSLTEMEHWQYWQLRPNCLL